MTAVAADPGFVAPGCPDLSGFADCATHRGADPFPVGDELLAAVREGIDAHPRSGQTELGPSEIGTPCNRWLAHRLAGTPHTGLTKPPWRQAVGTAVHEQFSVWLHRWNAEHGVRWLTDIRVQVGELYDGRPIYGTLDALDLITATVVDLKGLAVDIPIPTPDGWSTMGQLRVGDQVFGADGQPCTVTAKSPVHGDRPCFRVTFNDGASIITDNVHLWRFVADKGSNGDRQTLILSTEDAAAQISNPGTGQRHLRVVNPEALDLPDADLPIHPYVFGAWLGDGHRSAGVIGKPDDELFDHIRSCGYEVSEPHGERGINRSVYGLVTQLRAAGLVWPKNDPTLRGHQPMAGMKFVPAIYMRSGVGQRLALLQGLMDTDGTWNKKRKQAAFSNTDKALAHAVAELVRSLGWKAKLCEYTGHGFGKDVTAYSVAFTPYDANPFRLSRKADLVRLAGSKSARHRIVQSIEPVPIVATQCIQVDAADQMFLCGEEMVPTHNCPGPTALRTYGPGKPENPQYDVQLDLYGQGAVNAGFPVASVGVLRLPAAGELADAVWRARPHNPDRAQAALARAGAIARMVDTLGPAAIGLQPTTARFCARCPYFHPTATDLTTSCPGDPAWQAWRDARPDPLTALIA